MRCVACGSQTTGTLWKPPIELLWWQWNSFAICANPFVNEFVSFVFYTNYIWVVNICLLSQVHNGHGVFSNTQTDFLFVYLLILAFLFVLLTSISRILKSQQMCLENYACCHDYAMLGSKLSIDCYFELIISCIRVSQSLI